MCRNGGDGLEKVDDELTQCEDAMAAISRDIEGGWLPMGDFNGSHCKMGVGQGWKIIALSDVAQAMAAATLEENVVLE